MTEYESFLSQKHRKFQPSGFAPKPFTVPLFPFQSTIVTRALQYGKFAIFSECGTGKTPMQLEWSQQVVDETGLPVLILAPLAVTQQTKSEGAKFGIGVTVCRSQADCGHGVNVTNYDMLSEFDPSKFAGVVLDESSILKNYTGATKRLIMESFRGTPYKLCCTATPAPNDHLELGNHAEFLNVMPSAEMISRWFLNDSMKAGGYRLKAHAEMDFWRWVADWSVCIEKPSDLGFSDEGWNMPRLHIEQHMVEVDISGADQGRLIRMPDLSATGLHQELRRTCGDRAAAVAELVNNTPGAWIVWCHANYEADALKACIPDAVDVRGDESLSVKESKLLGFARGEFRILSTKPSIAGFGLNYQCCHQMAFVGLSYSYEALYQAIRRSWRFGQEYDVTAHIFIAETEGAVLETIRAKQARHERMKSAMAQAASMKSHSVTNTTGNGNQQVKLPNWLQSKGIIA